MSIRHWSLCLLMALPIGAVAKTPTTLDFAGSAWVDVDATGKAHVVEMEKVSKLGDVPKLAPVVERIKGQLKDAIESWRFLPAVRDGVAVESHTHVRVELEASDDGLGGMAVRIRSAHTGPGVSGVDRTALQLALMRAQAEGLVKLKLAYDGSGKVTGAEVAESMEYWHGKFSGQADKALRKGALEAANGWHLAPETVDGHPLPGTGTVTVVFCLSSDCGVAPLPGDSSREPWQFAATDPAVKLLSKVAGTTL